MSPTPSKHYASPSLRFCLRSRLPKSSCKLTLNRFFKHLFVLLLIFLYLVLHNSILTANSHLLPSPSPIRFDASTFFPSNSSPLVTVILTVYNVRPFIDQSLNATLSQSYQNLQIIIVDDASTDNTSQRITALTADDPRVSHLRLAANTLGGVATPSNIGMDAATGKYIAFVDGDDIPATNFIEKLVSVAEKSNADFVYCNFRLFETKSTKTTEAYDLKRWPSPHLIRLSQTHPLHPGMHPDTFALSPVPWRKLYRTDFLRRNNIRFPEGDYFFEDNSFHWLVNIHAEKISFLYDALVFHRTGRESQTTSSFRSKSDDGSTNTDHQTAKKNRQLSPRLSRKEENEFIASLASAQAMKYVPNCNYVGYRVAQCLRFKSIHCPFLLVAFLKWVVGTRWILQHVEAGNNHKLTEKSKSVHSRAVEYWLDRLDPDSLLRKELPDRPKRNTHRRVKLSIVVPTYNVEEFLPSFLNLLKQVTVSTEVIFVDDNSTDDTLMMLKDITEANKNIYVLRTKGNGAGRARNFGLLFCEGDYVVFLDSDDVFNPWLLDSAVWYAIGEDVEVLMLKYAIEYVRRTKKGSGFEITSSHGMFAEDENRWSEMRNEADLDKRKALAAKITNYPWNKLVKRELLNRENIFYGSTIVNNDVQFHWHSILTARSLEVFNKGVLVRHRKFEDRKTLTEAQGTNRLQLVDALVMTNRVLVSIGVTEKALFHKAWREFSENLIRWGGARVGKEARMEYDRKAKKMLAIIGEGQRDLLLAPP